MNIKTAHNNLISFWRVIFTYMIVLYHLFNQYAYWTDWAIAVEFFFMISGFLLAKDLNTHGRTPFEYVAHRLRRIYPEYLVAFLLGAVCLIVFRELSGITDIVKWFRGEGFREMLLIHYWPFGQTNVSASIPTWFLSVMIINSLFLYSAGKRCPHLLKEVIIPICVLLFWTISIRNNHSFMNDEMILGGYINLWFIRGTADMGIGYMLYEFGSSFSPDRVNDKALLSIGSIAFAAVIICSFFSGADGDIIYSVLLAIGIFCTFTCTVNPENRLIGFLSEISYSLFLFHHIFRRYLIPYFFESLSLAAIIVYLIVVTVFSSVIHFAVKTIIRTRTGSLNRGDELKI